MALSITGMNKILDHLAQRRSIKPMLMQGPGPDGPELLQILTLAARVPDHGKLAPWRFIVIEGEARARAGASLAEIFQAKRADASEVQLDFERKRFLQSPVTVVVVSCAAPHVKIPMWEQELSAGAVCMNLTIAATGAGYRTAWLTDWCAYDAQAQAALGVKPNERIAGFIHIGRFDGVAEDRVRPDMASLIHRL